jgi:hypothetical protein
VIPPRKDPDMRTPLVPRVLAALLALGCGCSLLVSFDPEGKPCGSEDACLEGYVCDRSKMCVRPDAGAAADGGGASDAGRASDGG